MPGKVSTPTLREGESAVATFGPDNPERTVPNAEHLVYIAGHTRQQVKRPAAGTEGYVLDHYSRTALDDLLNTVSKLLITSVRQNLPSAIFCDSLEVYGADWTPGVGLRAGLLR